MWLLATKGVAASVLSILSYAVFRTGLSKSKCLGSILSLGGLCVRDVRGGALRACVYSAARLTPHTAVSNHHAEAVGEEGEGYMEVAAWLCTRPFSSAFLVERKREESHISTWDGFVGGALRACCFFLVCSAISTSVAKMDSK